jgi:F-type H+-transporting ATPase subunit gamma
VATQREIRRRIKSVSSTKKITKTMEMVSTSKMKKMLDRWTTSKPYATKLEQIISHIRESVSGDIYDYEPLLQERDNSNKIYMLMLTGNRGLCGGYNANVIDAALKFKGKLTIEEGKEVLFHVFGKKGINYFKFVEEKMFKTDPNPEDKIQFSDSLRLGDKLIGDFLSGEVDEVYIAYTKVVSSSSQKPVIHRLLPITFDEKEVVDQVSGFQLEYFFEPNPYKIFSSILPLFMKVKLYTCFLESGYSEYFARRVAMKNATDAATDMVKDLTVKYNRARQAKITNEIAEIVGGAAALK